MPSLFPTLLAFLFAGLWFKPSPTLLIGYGEDVAFNLWTFEQVWHQFSNLGVHRLWTDAFWSAPILYPTPLTLALSENQIMPALLSWPLRIATGNGVLTMNVLALLISLAAFFSARLWFRAIGVRAPLAAWGALFFQANGWMQNQYAHYQNICIFIFPLVMWLGHRWLQRPSFARLLTLGLVAGNIGGWNLYFQIFVNAILSVGGIWIFFRKPQLRKQLFLLALLIGGQEFFWLRPYLEIRQLIGSFAASTDTMEATAWSWITHDFMQESWLQKVLPLYPQLHSDIENIGFLGLSWVLLAFLSFRTPQARPYLLAAAFCFWIALGPSAGLYSVVRRFPGMDALRALGRLQVLVGFFSLTGILLALQTRPRKKAALFLFLIALELLPARGAQTMEFPLTYWGPATPWEETLAREVGREAPILGIGKNLQRHQTTLFRTQQKVWLGYSGRSPLSAWLLLEMSHSKAYADSVLEEIHFTRAQWVFSDDAEAAQILDQKTYLRRLGCHSHVESSPCLYQVQWSQPELSTRADTPRLALDRDFVWTDTETAEGSLSVFKAMKPGILDYDRTGTCRIEEQIYFGGLPLWTKTRAISILEVPKASFDEHETVMTQSSKQWIYRLPPAIRASKRYQIRCGV